MIFCPMSKNKNLFQALMVFAITVTLLYAYAEFSSEDVVKNQEEATLIKTEVSKETMATSN